MNIVCLDLEGVLVPKSGLHLQRRQAFLSLKRQQEMSRIMISS